MRRLILPLLASTALLAACGSDQESANEPPPAASGDGSGTRVLMKDIEFVPEDITVKVGETITWVNQDSVPHNVVNAQEGEQPKSELFNEGGTYEFTPTEAGKIDYVCTIHPGMDGTITVE
jgi:plastocyanin